MILADTGSGIQRALAYDHHFEQAGASTHCSATILLNLGVREYNPAVMTSQTTPLRLNLKKDEKLEIEWADGLRSTYTISMLRSLCPCAHCRTVREQSNPHDISPTEKRKPLLTILPGNYSGSITGIDAQKVGKYAIKLVFSDQHDTGIFSVDYLREISPQN